MKLLHHSQEVTVDEGVTCSVKSRLVTVTGPRGTLTKSFRHLKVGIYQSNIFSQYFENVLLLQFLYVIPWIQTKFFHIECQMNVVQKLIFYLTLHVQRLGL